MVAYNVRVYSPGTSGTSYAAGSLVADLRDFNNLGWADYINGVPEMFMSLSQEDPQLSAIASAVEYGDAHVKVYRNGTNVWSGWLGLEWDSTQNDVILYGYGYLAGTWWTLSPWAKVYTNSQIDTIVSDAWTNIKTTTTNSTLKWVGTGTIEAPVTTSGGATAIVIPKYQAYWKRGLDIFREMAAIATAGTTNIVKFEITPAGTFNFWKNRTADKTDMKVRYGDDKVRGFNDYRMPVYRRNAISASGASPVSTGLKTTVTNSTDITNHGRREEPLFFSWVRDFTELNRATDLRLAKAQRKNIDLSVSFHADKMAPPYEGGDYRVGDRLPIYINRGITSIDGLYLIVGQMTTFARGGERVHLLLQERSGA